MSEKKNKSLLKDIGILLCVWGPLLFIIIGGIMWRNDRFEGTVMEILYPALFFGFAAAFLAVIMVSNIAQYSPVTWMISAVVVLVATVVFYMIDLKLAIFIELGVMFAVLCLVRLIKWIAGS